MKEYFNSCWSVYALISKCTRSFISINMTYFRNKPCLWIHTPSSYLITRLFLCSFTYSYLWGIFNVSPTQSAKEHGTEAKDLNKQGSSRSVVASGFGRAARHWHWFFSQGMYIPIRTRYVWIIDWGKLLATQPHKGKAILSVLMVNSKRLF